MDNDGSKLVKLLRDLGLSNADALTYQALLELDSVSIRKIAAITGINRGTTYESLKRLTTIGLASVRRKGNNDRYIAEPPSHVLNIIRDKRRDLLDTAAKAKELIPKYVAKKTPGGQPLVRFYEADEGVITILKDILQTCRDVPNRQYVAYSSAPVRHYLYRKFPQFTKRRVAEGIHVKVIAAGGGGEPAALSERKWLKTEPNLAPSSYIIIYGDKVATISIAPDDTPYGVTVEDRGAASLQRLLFFNLWESLGE